MGVQYYDSSTGKYDLFHGHQSQSPIFFAQISVGETFYRPMSLAGVNSNKNTYIYRVGSVIRLDSVIPTLVYL